ncbi:MAG: chemotaxis protein CheW [Turneriella sp.]|mgnify:CR=1 FL=1
MSNALGRTGETENRLAEDIKQFVAFRLGQEDYAVDILQVQEIIRLENITWLPRKPAYILGIINLRGEIIPIVELRTKFGLKGIPATKSTRILITQIEGRLVGLVVDMVHEVLDVLQSQIDTEPELLNADRRVVQYVKGMAKVDKRIFIILDLERILTREEQANLSGL